MSAVDQTFQAPIPGMSLTHKMGSLPHEKPPRFVDPNQALEYIWKILHQKEALKQIWIVMEQGVTIWQLRRTLLLKLCLDGIIQLNLSIIIAPVVDRMLEVIGKSKGIDVKANPKFRSKSFDKMMDDRLNEKLGRKDNPQPIPVSALKSSMIPTAADITKAHEDFIGRKNPKNGILDKAIKQQKVQE